MLLGKGASEPDSQAEPDSGRGAGSAGSERLGAGGSGKEVAFQWFRGGFRLGAHEVTAGETCRRRALKVRRFTSSHGAETRGSTTHEEVQLRR
eukprot:1555190-Rhodomonas_salina.1